MHDPTPQLRETVERMAATTLPQDMIAAILGITPKTLRKHYREELDRGLGRTIKAAATNVARMAIGAFDDEDSELHCLLGERKVIPDDQTQLKAAQFLLSTRGGFKVGSSLELTGKDGGPVEVADYRTELAAALLKHQGATEDSEEPEADE